MMIQEREFVLGNADVALNLNDTLKEPEKFKDPCYHSNIHQMMKWRGKFSEEINEIKEKGVYEKNCKSELPNGRNK
jgi:hypothetical protein